MKIGIVGLGYVGLPLAVEFAKRYLVKGFDINLGRVNELNLGNDSTLEIEEHELKSVLETKDGIGLTVTNIAAELIECNVFIVTVPTPVDKNNHPDLTPLVKASTTIGGLLKKDDIVIYESTVYPGATEEVCVPILEKTSNLKFNIDFYCGYSPERINPGDKEHSILQIKKVTSGSTQEIAEKIDSLYGSIITAGTHLAPSIKVAEAAKVIENAQRDINIAFVNELAKIFNKLEIDTQDVLEAASTKWNFLPFKPGLVGGHCIGVDPYYLAQKAKQIGYHPEIILSGRRLNDSMGEFVATEVIKLMVKQDIDVKKAKVLMLGFTFKENCPDIRNTGAINVYNSLASFNIDVDVYDPWVINEEVEKEYELKVISNLTSLYDGIMHVVAHKQFETLDLEKLKKPNAIVYDIKGTLPKRDITKRL